MAKKGKKTKKQEKLDWQDKEEEQDKQEIQENPDNQDAQNIQDPPVSQETLEVQDKENTQEKQQTQLPQLTQFTKDPQDTQELQQVAAQSPPSPKPSHFTADRIKAILNTSYSSELSSDQENQRARTEDLLPVYDALHSLAAVPAESIQMDELIQVLADGARAESWRLPIGGADILALALDLLDPPHPAPLRIQALRLIGNCCAEIEQNRERVLKSGRLPALILQLEDDETLAFAIHVLFNALADYEPIQAKAAEIGLGARLTDILAGPRLSKVFPFVEFICRILALLASQDSELSREGAVTTAVTLLSLAKNEQDHTVFGSITSVALAYLTFDRIRNELATAPISVTIFLDALLAACTRFGSLPEAAADLTAELKRIQIAFLKALADVSGSDQFVASHPLGCSAQLTLQDWLCLPNPQLQSAACLALGNLARSDETSIALVGTYQVHPPVIGLLSGPCTPDSDAQLLHAALSLLKNLAIATINKPVLAATGLLGPTLLPRIWSTNPIPEVQFAAASLCRLLLVDCPSNVSALCGASIGPDPHSCAQSLIELFLHSDAEPTKVEAARAIATICRLFHTSILISSLPHSPASNPDSATPTSADSIDRAAWYAQHPNLDKPLAFLATQFRFPTLRTDVWYVLALMCRSRDGAAVVLRVLHDDNDAAMAVLRTAVAASDTIDAPAEVEATARVRVDRQNGLGLIAALLRDNDDQLPAVLKEEMEGMVRLGSGLAVLPSTVIP